MQIGVIAARCLWPTRDSQDPGSELQRKGTASNAIIQLANEAPGDVRRNARQISASALSGRVSWIISIGRALTGRASLSAGAA